MDFENIYWFQNYEVGWTFTIITYMVIGGFLLRDLSKKYPIARPIAFIGLMLLLTYFGTKMIIAILGGVALYLFLSGQESLEKTTDP